MKSNISIIKQAFAYYFYKLLRLGMSCQLIGKRTTIIKMYPQSRQEFARIRPLSKGIYNELQFLKEFIAECTPGKIVFDIGAHIGTFTLFAAEAVGAKGKVYSFEMDHLNYLSVCNNVLRNNFKNVVVINKAISSNSGVAHYIRPSNTSGEGGSSISESESASHLAEKVSLDYLVKHKRIKVPNIVKIDVEGHEIEVIKGMSSILQEYSVSLYVEVHESILINNNEDYNSFNSLLEGLGYYQSTDLSIPFRKERHLLYKNIKR